MKNTKTIIICLAAILTAAIFIGCKTVSLNASVFNAEQLAVDSATSATHEFNLYYESSTNQTALASQRDSVYKTDRDLAASLSVLDALRLQYTTNASASNQVAVLAALATVQSQATNIVALVNTLKHQ